MSRRTTARRGLKKRGIFPSFGDIVLPVVSVAAIGLLIMAGRQFFINGLKTSPGITSTRAFADSPAIMAEREKKQESAAQAAPAASAPSAPSKPEPVKPEPKPKPASKPLPLAVAENPVAPPIAEVKPAVVQPPKPAVKPTPAPKPAPAPAKKTEEVKPIKPSNLPANKQWRVQTGSYTTKSGAEDAVKKIKKSGFQAMVYKNPASKHYKVWVLGGESKYQAGLVLDAMKKLGYKTSFAFPPAK